MTDKIITISIICLIGVICVTATLINPRGFFSKSYQVGYLIYATVVVVVSIFIIAFQK
ncbi:hypothetical protein [Pediococcus stilesii]|uniref:hypothetical protein n=1 Tax=Pediococcus stilesii TaxID=331679 RepID=UPI0014872623|nr:hypothetical protein [Pediococcus stilesii]